MAAKKNGYQVDIKLLAVDSRLSLLGIYLRYELMKSVSGIGRKVSSRDHDLRFMVIPYTIDRIHKAHLYDNFHIYARSVVLEGTHQVEGVVLVARNPAEPLAVYKGELQRPWPEKLKLYFDVQCNKVLDLMKGRNASAKESNEFIEDVGFKQSQQQNLGRKRGPRL